MVRKKRLELLRREALEPKSSASTNSATFAFRSMTRWVIEGADYTRNRRLVWLQLVETPI